MGSGIATRTIVDQLAVATPVERSGINDYIDLEDGTHLVRLTDYAQMVDADLIRIQRAKGQLSDDLKKRVEARIALIDLAQPSNGFLPAWQQSRLTGVHTHLTELSGDVSLLGENEKATAGIETLRGILNGMIGARLKEHAATFNDYMQTLKRPLWIVGEVPSQDSPQYYAARLASAVATSNIEKPELFPVVEDRDGVQGTLPAEVELGIFPLHQAYSES